MDNKPTQLVGETYFFRDHGQMDLIRLRLLPELIERRRRTKTLRLWSAGCASGEEAYSLAMLTDMVLGERDGWNILILGTDVDRTALAKAREGIYGKWSFRMVQPSLQRRYFQGGAQGWKLDERIRSMVTFRPVDLVSESFPSGELQEMDLILCRNVFIYYNEETVLLMVSKLRDALRENGYLLTGHTELLGLRIRNLQARLMQEGTVYLHAPARPRVSALPQVPLVSPPSLLSKPSAPPNKAVHGLAPEPDETPAPATLLNAEDLLTEARALADRGEYDLAEQQCGRARELSPLEPASYFLLAQLAQIRGKYDLAQELLEKNLYLDPRSVAGHLELASLCERAGNLPRAQILRRAALDILLTLPGDAVVDLYEATAAEMVRWMS